MNNNIENLRWSTKKEYCQNQKIQKNNTSGTKGVTWNKASNKWKAQINIDGIYVYLELYSNIEDARATRIAAANKAFGVFTNSCELAKA